ncbi:TetR/AcrR family transcriptional regulator [Tunturiibacter gelidoferens]|uniref:TetR/AcrR family transcriptional regulator n=1 Tax=Tunturiibacter gelidiferens TaxID=3069689 RepID=UPI0028C455C6|nr:helix-turn-helix domain-containing protein [Edaphobacter lichenicola]
MLMESLARLLNKKQFEDISIQEIAGEASLNRATFYLHYADKNALLQAMTAERFKDLIARRGLSFTDCDGALRHRPRCLRLSRGHHRMPQSVDDDAARRLHHPRCGRHISGRRRESRDTARC